MSEPKLISPLLDGYLMGNPISDHDGVRCCPAMQQETAKKVIVKIISIPASQVKLDALMLAGAFSDQASALSYFQELANGIAEEADILKRLSRLEGFVAFEGWQIVPMEDETGFDVYLVGSYRSTLEKFFRREPMTHLGAVNLGLDLCAALAVCRRMGYLYVDLKPSNIYICEDHEYRIGDLGFVSLSSLKYASLPDKYRSVYTAPEITDAYSSLNTTMDVYAAGLILYQVYNNGTLPFEGSAPTEPLPPPEYADYEMADIILKACALNPEDRWQDPLQMGQALVRYMQRNGANDVPIVPPVIPEEPEAVRPDAEVSDAEQDSDTAGETPAEDASGLVLSAPAEEDLDMEQFLANVEDALGIEHPVQPEPAVEEEASGTEPTETEISLEDVIPAEDLQLINEILADETVPSEESAAGLDDATLSEEATEMLAQADDLISHQIPEPVVAPAPIEVPVPPLPVEEEQTPAEDTQPEQTDAEAIVSEDTSENAGDELAPGEDAGTDAPEEAGSSEPDPLPGELSEEQAHRKTKNLNTLLGVLISVLLALLLICGGFLFYEQYYLQDIQNLTLSGDEDRLTVLVSAEIENDLLTVFCADTYGNVLSQKVSNGAAQFTGLKPDTRYRVYVEISGFHKLTGVTSEYYTSPALTTIVNFTAVTGSEDGSAILSFTVQGKDSQQWRIRYSAAGEEDRSVTFSGHMVTISGLTPGKTYTFRLESSDDLYTVGSDTVTHTASVIVYAEALQIDSFLDGVLSVSWHAPEGVYVDSWTVRCYNSDGFEQTITVTEPYAVFEGLSISSAYTVEVVAAGMAVGTRTYVTANSITVTSAQALPDENGQLVISWDYRGSAPENGWYLLYTVDGSAEQLILCDSTTAVLEDPVPGASYSITIQAASGATVFGGTLTYDTAPAADFSRFAVTNADMVFSMCMTPFMPSWSAGDLTYTSAFASGDRASILIKMNADHQESSAVIRILLVIRNADGVPVSITTQSNYWYNIIWASSYGMVSLPVLPAAGGEYTVDVFFDGAFVTTQGFTVTADPV